MYVIQQPLQQYQSFIKIMQSCLHSRATNMKLRAVFILLGCAVGSFAWTSKRSEWNRGLGIEPGPSVKATKGEVWPKPQQQILLDQYLSVNLKNFTFEVVGETCDIIQEAIKRYQRSQRLSIKKFKIALKKVFGNKRQPALGDINSLQINLTKPCEKMPYLHMDEKYTLEIGSSGFPSGQLQSSSVWGILRGLESFMHLIHYSDNGEVLIRGTVIEDYPRFPHRGLHVDTARHYIPLKILLTVIDGMAINKFNVFHWHLVDDQSFPYESTVFPELSQMGAYSSLHVYTQADIARVIEYARLRGIRVMPEFDTPGHTRSWGIAYPQLLTKCYDSSGSPDGSLGPMHPLSNFTYDFMSQLLTELTQVFPDKFIHLGGDEVPFDCWLSNPEIAEYLEVKNITAEELEEIYIQRIINATSSLNSTAVVWQEVFDNGVQIPQDTVVHVWKDWIDYMDEMAKVTLAGFSAILSSCWYMDHLSSGGDWQKFYECDPTFFPGSQEAYRRVLGGEVCMWSEVVNANNILSRIWPRASAAAEKLWSTTTLNDLDLAIKRLEEHACRMNLRGIPAQPPNGPGFCPYQINN